ncbi:MAG: hypothetical protein R6V07_02775 [Armatimonadota bacterium]
MPKLLICSAAFALAVVLTGCRGDERAKCPEGELPTEHIGQQLMVAGLFGVSPDHVTLAQVHAMGGDRHWSVQLPPEMYPDIDPRSLSTFAITDDGVPVYADWRAIPDAVEVSERWPDGAPAARSVPPEQREFAERACYTVGAMLLLPALSDEYLSVVSLCPLGESMPIPDVCKVRLQMNKEPWSQLGAVEMSIPRDGPFASMIEFRAPERR